MLIVNGKMSLVKLPAARAKVAKSEQPFQHSPPVHVRHTAETQSAPRPPLKLKRSSAKVYSKRRATATPLPTTTSGDPPGRPPLETIFPREHTLDIYTDGSHIKGSFVRGWGAWARWKGQEYEMSSCSNNLDEAISNPTLELMAAVQVLTYMQGKCPPEIKRIRIIADYTGVQKYGMLLWTPENSKIVHFRTQACWLRDLSVAYRSDRAARKPGCPKLEFLHVRGHSGIEGNHHADRMAKSNVDSNSFDRLLALQAPAAVDAAAAIEPASAAQEETVL